MADLFTLNADPKRGDIVIFYRHGTFAHTGIVTKVDGDRFETVEGNTSGGSTIIANGGGVCKKSYYNSNLPGTKFCRPAYEEIEESEEINMEELAEVKAEVAAMSAKYDAIIDKMGAELEALRKADEPMIYNYIDENMPQWAHEGVQWCVDNGIIQGTGEGLGLDDKDLKYCTIMKRVAESFKA
jgi:hypothetical protein